MALNREYKILSANTTAALEALVNTYLDNGWLLAGGLTSLYPDFYQAVHR